MIRVSLAGALVVLAAVSLVSRGTIPPPTVPPPIPPATSTVAPARPAPPQRPTVGTPAPTPGGPGAVVIGQIVDNDGGPVPTVAVRLIGHTAMQTVVSDARGRFFFTDIAPGEYVVTARKHGFYDGAFGKRRSGGQPLPFALFPGQAIPDMRIELFRAAVITGQVVDEASEPVIGARVVAMRRQFVDGDWQYVAAGSDLTDDQGMYRVFGLEPGEYLVSTPTIQISGAAGEPNERPASAGPPDTERIDRAYPTLFYPASRYFLLALPVLIGSGEVRYAIDFHWAPVAAHTVSGRLEGPSPAAAEQVVKLVPIDRREADAGNEIALTLSAPDGSFVFTRVPEGEYRIEAGHAFAASASSLLSLPSIDGETLRPEYWGRASVVVADADVSDLVVPMRTGLTLTGTIVAETSESAPSTVSFVRVPITIVPSGPGLSPVATPRILADGRFSATNLIPGKYYVRVGTLPPGVYLKAATAAGRDLLDAPADLGDGDLGDVRITLTDRGTEILGSVRDARMQAASGATVIVMPAASSVWSANRTRQTRASTTGQFAIDGLPPGDYLIVAIDDAAADGWQDSLVLNQLRTLATRVTLRSAERLGVQLRLSALRRQVPVP